MVYLRKPGPNPISPNASFSSLPMNPYWSSKLRNFIFKYKTYITLAAFVSCLLLLISTWSGTPSNVGGYNSAEVYQGYHDRYRAFGRGCFSPFGEKEGHKRLPSTDLLHKPFDPSKPITLVMDCTHNTGKFNPFHWSIAVWEFYGFLMNDTLTIREAVVPCSRKDFNLDDTDNSWIMTYWPAVMSKLNERKIPLRFTNEATICFENMVYNERILGNKAIMDEMRHVAYHKCRMTQEELMGRPPSKSVAILTRQDTRTFSESDLRKFTRAVEAHGFTVKRLTIPRDYCDQVRMFAARDFKFFLTPHGAQETNSLFLGPGTHVVEFFPAKFHIAMYCYFSKSTPITWAQVHSNHNPNVKGSFEITETCSDPPPNLSTCQKFKLCRSFSKMFRTKMYDPEHIAEYVHKLALEDQARHGDEP